MVQLWVLVRLQIFWRVWVNDGILSAIGQQTQGSMAWTVMVVDDGRQPSRWSFGRIQRGIIEVNGLVEKSGRVERVFVVEWKQERR